MKLLFIGDIVGEPGRKAVLHIVPRLRASMGVQFVVANGENSAGGSGITPRIAEELYASGVHVITTGDHLWDQKEVTELLETEARFLRPANYPPGVLGFGSGVFEVDGLPPVGVINLQGRTFMAALENPFRIAEAEVSRLKQHTKIILVDFHAEATSEKIAMGRMLDGKVSAVIGTHTHVQTADEQVFPGGTAFLCDAGFTGPYASILGRDIEPIIKRFQHQTPQRFTVAKGDVRLHGAVVDVDEETGKARSIVRVSEPLGEHL
ncbi:MAG: TIGR00282 family metallophosphoesterase [Verrucomicrobiales bacterium]|nr:TIGR00282 family metallophosphoesterase [Verrucomicrobiales bacterium]